MVSELKYEEATPLTKTELLTHLQSSEPKIVADALYSATRYEQDLVWVQQQCLEKLNSDEVLVRWAAATCLGDLAFWRRFQGNIDAVRSALQFAARDPQIADPACFSLSLVNQAAPKETR